ncbi:hypothetical protein GOBAR_AA18289 [Gossypium barbadense]|uniref:Uncharacterized protein n=1 Tax=Gossypium barbadense TaxID=3634 RepID=A0A2P5XGB8_GOSBA|nr:hypothetical protein GOBAR_AA18289 [Gossypium barbadense]
MKSQDKFNTSPNQLKVGDKVLLAATDPRIATPEPNEEIPLTVLSIFPYGTIEVIHPKFITFKLIAGMRSVNSSHHLDHAEERPHDQAHGRALGRMKTGHETWQWVKLPKQQGRETRTCLETVIETENVTRACDTPVPSTRGRHCQNENGHGPMYTGVGEANKVQCRLHVIQLADAVRALLTIDPWGFFFEIFEPTYLEFTLELCSTFHLQTVMTNFDDPGMVQFRLGGLRDLVAASATYDPICSKASALPPSFREMREHRHRHHPRRLFLMEYGEWPRHRPRLLYWPRHLPPNGAAQERGYLYRALCYSTGSALRAPQHSSSIILPHSHWPDVLTGHLEHAKYEDDQETTWHLPSLVPPRRTI